MEEKIPEGHPYFNLAALLADDSQHVGKQFSECMEWCGYYTRDLPEALGKMTMVAADPDALGKVGDVKLMLLALPPWTAPDFAPKFAEAGIPGVSESAAFKADPDVPLVVPEINADHLSILENH